MPARDPSRSAVAEVAALRPSKTGLKKQMHELQELGEALARLPAERFAQVELSESLRDAIEMLKRTRSHEGRRRQLQYVGKLMRGADAEPIREALAAYEMGSAAQSLALHRIEAWRAEMVAADDSVTRWIDEHPETDAKRLRDLVRSARSDLATPPEQRHGRAYRQLFQFIKAQLEDE